MRRFLRRIRCEIFHACFTWREVNGRWYQACSVCLQKDLRNSMLYDGIVLTRGEKMEFVNEESPQFTFFIIVEENDFKYKRHYSLQNAFDEANRLAKIEGKVFFICRAKYDVSPPPIQNVKVRMVNRGSDNKWRYDLGNPLLDDR